MQEHGVPPLSERAERGDGEEEWWSDGSRASSAESRMFRTTDSRSARGHRHLMMMRVSAPRSRPRFGADRLGATQLLVPSIINAVTDRIWIRVQSGAELIGLRKIVVTGKEPDPSDTGGETRD
ncbi:hypothetical protein GW17_00015647 [Ensete ventricosum]|nr:hypothetical protein GW17_00015647 [Ensete ventricosum]